MGLGPPSLILSLQVIVLGFASPLITIQDKSSEQLKRQQFFYTASSLFKTLWLPLARAVQDKLSFVLRWMTVNVGEIEAFRMYALLNLILKSKYTSSRKPWTEQHCGGNKKEMTLWEVKRSSDILKTRQRPCPTTHTPNRAISQVVVCERKRWGWREPPSPCGVTQHCFHGCMNYTWTQCQGNVLLSNMKSATWASIGKDHGWNHTTLICLSLPQDLETGIPLVHFALRVREPCQG